MLKLEELHWNKKNSIGKSTLLLLVTFEATDEQLVIHHVHLYSQLSNTWTE
jgi:hypothetical protein